MSEQRRECDVLVVGAGPAGIAAGARAAEAGARVVVVDEGAGPGGQIWRPSLRAPSPAAARRWTARLDASGATVLRSTAVVDVVAQTAGGFAALAEAAGSVVEIAARSVILATGARERFLPFPGWTLPNVFGVGGAQALLKAGLDYRGKRVVIAGSGPLLLPVAASLAHAGANLLYVAEQAPRARVVAYAAGLWRKPSTLAQAASLRSAFLSTPYSTGTWVSSAGGDTTVRSATLTNGRTSRTFECDILCAAFGLVPNVELARLLGCATHAGTVTVAADQATTVVGVYCAGEPTGIGGVDLSLIEGEIAALAATGRPPESRLIAARTALRREAERLDHAFALQPRVRELASPDTVICRCEDVRLRDLDRTWTSRQAKLYTRAGMGPCQGRICGAALQTVMNWSEDSIRLPTQPARVSTLLAHSSIASTTSTTKSNEHGAH
jgi:NADPH-dependent 2,4-dienoyl-CoA reductase/sulfur reductase-like enzyme